MLRPLHHTDDSNENPQKLRQKIQDQKQYIVTMKEDMDILDYTNRGLKQGNEVLRQENKALRAELEDLKCRMNALGTPDEEKRLSSVWKRNCCQMQAEKDQAIAERKQAIAEREQAIAELKKETKWRLLALKNFRMADSKRAFAEFHTEETLLELHKTRIILKKYNKVLANCRQLRTQRFMLTGKGFRPRYLHKNVGSKKNRQRIAAKNEYDAIMKTRNHYPWSAEPNRQLLWEAKRLGINIMTKKWRSP